MSPEFGQQERLTQPQNRTIAVMRFGESHYLVNETNDAAISFKHIDPVRRSLDYIKATKQLPSSSIIEFPDVDDGRLTIAKLGFQEPTIRYSQRTSGVDEPTLTFTGRDGKREQNVPVTVDLHERELRDLFLKQPDKEPVASFVAFDTAEHELIGVTLRREFPVLFALTEGRDNNSFSANAGILEFVDGVYNRLFEHRTPFQTQVDQEIFKAMAPDGKISFRFDTSTPAKERQRDVQKRVYQIQALLLAMKAEAGQGIDDPELLAHAPFLKAKVGTQQSTDLFSRFSRILETPVGPATAQAGAVVIDNSIWENLVAEPESKLLVDPNRRVLSSVQTQRPQSQSRVVTRPTAQSVIPDRPQPTPVRNERPARQTTPQPVKPETTPRLLTEKQKAILLAHELDTSLRGSLKHFKDLPVTQVNAIQVEEFQEHVTTLIDTARGYTSQRRRGKAPENPILPQVMVRGGMIDIAGIQDEAVFEFLTGEVRASYKEKIDEAFKKWDEYVLPLYNELHSRSERKLSRIVAGGPFTTNDPARARTFIHELEGILHEDPQTGRKPDINTGDLSKILLSTQIISALQEQYVHLKKDGESVEIDNWAAYTQNTLARLAEKLKNGNGKHSIA